MNPILLDLGIVKVYWYSVFIFFAILISCSLILRESKRYSIPENFMINLFFWDIIVAFIGARLYYVCFNLGYYSHNLLEILKVWEGGLAIHGGLLFGAIFTIIYTKRYKVNPLFIFDMASAGLIIGQAIGRWGNFFNGEAHGPVTTLDTLHHFLTPGFIIDGMEIGGVYYLPTFYYESLWCILGFIVILILRRTKYIKIGQLTSIYMIWYGVGRFFIESLRTDSLMIGNFRMAQIVSVLMVIFGIIMIVLLGKGSKFDNKYNDVENMEKINY